MMCRKFLSTCSFIGVKAKTEGVCVKITVVRIIEIQIKKSTDSLEPDVNESPRIKNGGTVSYIISLIG